MQITLRIKSRVTRRYSRANLPSPLPPLVTFWRHNDGTDSAVLCQWFPSPFSYDGRR